MKASLTNYHQSPRKVRLVADLIRGQTIPQARATLLFLNKKSSPAMRKLLDSAVENARQSGASPEELIVKRISIDKGAVMHRVRPFSRGRSGTLRKTMSIISLELGAKAGSSKKALSKRMRSTKPLATSH